MRFVKEVDVEIEIFPHELDLSFEDIQDMINGNLCNEQMVRLGIWLLQKVSVESSKEVIKHILNNLGIDEAKALIKELDSEFLSLEEYRARALKFSKNGGTNEAKRL